MCRQSFDQGEAVLSCADLMQTAVSRDQGEAVLLLHVAQHCVGKAYHCKSCQSEVSGQTCCYKRLNLSVVMHWALTLSMMPCGKNATLRYKLGQAACTTGMHKMHARHQAQHHAQHAC